MVSAAAAFLRAGRWPADALCAEAVLAWLAHRGYRVGAIRRRARALWRRHGVVGGTDAVAAMLDCARTASPVEGDVAAAEVPGIGLALGLVCAADGAEALVGVADSEGGFHLLRVRPVAVWGVPCRR